MVMAAALRPHGTGTNVRRIQTVFLVTTGVVAGLLGAQLWLDSKVIDAEGEQHAGGIAHLQALQIGQDLIKQTHDQALAASLYVHSGRAEYRRTFEELAAAAQQPGASLAERVDRAAITDQERAALRDGLRRSKLLFA